MASTTITITRQAYDSLDSLRQGTESFSEAILRLTVDRQKEIWKRLLQQPPDTELADALDVVVKQRPKARMQTVKF